MMRSTLFWVCALAVVGAALALPRSKRHGDKTPCDASSNPCADGKTCVLGRCRRACNDSDDCHKGKKCGDDGFCARERDGCDFGKFGFGKFGHHGNFSCDATSKCKDGATCVEGKCHTTCKDDTGCPHWKSCQSGVCKHKPQCDAAKPCSGGRACVNETCLFPCAGDDVCDPWNQCKEGHCARKEDDSIFNYDDWWKCDSSAATDSCKEGRKCVDGKCARPCAADDDCKSFWGKHHKQTCAAGFCVKEKKDDADKKGGKHRCDDATPCTEAGKVCNEGKCRTPCSASTPCPEGKFCDMKESSASAPSTATSAEAGFCRREHKCKGFGFGKGHRGGKKCDANQKCDNGKDCVDSVCLRKCDADKKCRHGKECSADGYCRRINLSCQAAADCTNGRQCVDNFCRTPCDEAKATDACPDKLTCKEGFCRFEGFFGLHKRESCDATKPCSDAAKVCVEGRCRPACSADKPCDHGKTCSKDGYCTRQDNDDHDEANETQDDDADDDDDENEGEHA